MQDGTFTYDLTKSIEALVRREEVQRRTGKNPLDAVGDLEGEVYRPQELQGIHGSLMILVKDVGDYLEKTYPGWLWKIAPDQRNGIITILSGRLHPNYGLVIHIQDLHDDPQRRVLRELAGQLLERFGMPRRAFWNCASEYKAAKRNPMGHCIPDLQDKHDWQLMRRERSEQGRKVI